MIKGNLCPFCHLLSTQVANVSHIWTPNRAKYWFDIKMTTSPHSISCHLWWVIQCPSHSHPFMSNPRGKNVGKTDLVLPMFHLYQLSDQIKIWPPFNSWHLHYVYNLSIHLLWWTHKQWTYEDTSYVVPNTFTSIICEINFHVVC